MVEDIGTVGVVIPHFNCPQYIGECIDSLRRQTFTDWRAVVVDDGSSPESYRHLEVLLQGDDRFSIVCQSNQGTAAARNRGRSELEGVDAYLFLDHDDSLIPDALELLVSKLRQDPGLIAAAGLPLRVDSSGREIPCDRLWGSRRYRVEKRGFRTTDGEGTVDFASVVVMCYFTTPGQVVVHRRAFEEGASFDLDLRGTDDWDFWISVTRFGPIHVTPRATLLYREHTTNASNNSRRMWINMLKVRNKWRKWALTPEAPAGTYAMLRRANGLFLIWWTYTTLTLLLHRNWRGAAPFVQAIPCWWTGFFRVWFLGSVPQK